MKHLLAPVSISHFWTSRQIRRIRNLWSHILPSIICPRLEIDGKPTRKSTNRTSKSTTIILVRIASSHNIKIKWRSIPLILPNTQSNSPRILHSTNVHIQFLHHSTLRQQAARRQLRPPTTQHIILLLLSIKITLQHRHIHPIQITRRLCKLLPIFHPRGIIILLVLTFLFIDNWCNHHCGMRWHHQSTRRLQECISRSHQ
mmetsp:Transcript_16819/g.28584  ORF Transcript_16819/g.28584 Transcript_16819/m.28584 type:complete len:201 (-) Transcript_16819:969-1571(-)